MSDASTSVVTACTDCGKQYKLDARMAGRTVKCKKCGNAFTATPVDGVIAQASAPAASVRSSTPRVAPRAAANAGTSATARPRSANAPARAARTAPPPPPPAPAEPDVPSLNDMAELEATGTPNQFSNLAPVQIEVAKDPWYVAKKKPITIHDADPKVAKAYEKKMSRRNVIAGGAGFGGLGVAIFVIRVVVRSANKLSQKREEETERNESVAAHNAAVTNERDEYYRQRQAAIDNESAQRKAEYEQQRAAQQAENERAAAERQAAYDEMNRRNEEARRQRQAQDEANRQAFNQRMKENGDRMAADAQRRMEESRRRVEEMNRRR